MLQDRLNELALLSIKNERLELLDYKTLINDFAAQKVRRLILKFEIYISLFIFIKFSLGLNLCRHGPNNQNSKGDEKNLTHKHKRFNKVRQVCLHSQEQSIIVSFFLFINNGVTLKYIIYAYVILNCAHYLSMCIILNHVQYHAYHGGFTTAPLTRFVIQQQVVLTLYLNICPLIKYESCTTISTLVNI